VTHPQNSGFDLTGRTALVTGASRGIGRAIAVAFARHGADVALGGRDLAALDETRAAVEETGRKAVVVPADVTDPEAVRGMVDAALSGLGHLDTVVNNAGGNNFMAPFAQVRPEGWDKSLRLNLDSVVQVCRAVAPYLLERRAGSVINVASVTGLTGVPMMSHYATAKAAVIALSKSLAVEWAWAGVRCNALVPGWVATELTQFARGDDTTEQGLLARVPMQRWATAEEIAGPAVFLASDAASFITGQSLVVDGGLSAG
jgi:NAD(P)-dependent dehydrogenase (short-subunit alcohol dehydrogenase family)